MIEDWATIDEQLDHKFESWLTLEKLLIDSK